MESNHFPERITSSLETLEGTVKRVVFHNPENGYTVFQLSIEDHLEPVTVESTPDGIHKLHFLGPGFCIDYRGPFKPYLNAVWVSPSQYKVYPFKNELFGYFYDKESLLAGLLESVRMAGAEVMTGTLALGAENTSNGVTTYIRGKNGTEALEAKAAVAADGNMSKVVDSLGLNRKRVTFAATSWQG